MGWYEQRFEQTEKKLRYDCQVCNTPMWFPPSKHGKYLTCGGNCHATVVEQAASLRIRKCLTCGTEFRPRGYQIKQGQGKYCSNKCAIPALESGRTPEARKKSGLAKSASYASGRIVAVTGPAHHSWKGGKEAHKQRKKQSGALAKSLRKYRANNPDKVREFTLRRKSRKYGRLPRGTVNLLGSLQKWKCVVCKCDIRSKYHVDHIMPLAKGGLHVPENIQLLCPTCNVQKSAKHPIDFMQQKGFLL